MNNSDQAIAERNLNGQRVEFEKWARSKYLDVRTTLDAWNRPVYYPHIECMWEGWKGRTGVIDHPNQDWRRPGDHPMWKGWKEYVEKTSSAVKAPILSPATLTKVTVVSNNGGYHLTEIPKGTLGDMSKIEEEFAEFKDAMSQDNRIMALQELSDLIGAIEAFTLSKHNVTLSDLIQMKNATKRAFESGHRK